MSELSPEARNLIDGSRHADDPSESDRERVRARLARELGTVALLSGAASVAVHKAAATSAASASSSGTTGAFQAAGTGLGAALSKLTMALGLAGALGGTVWLIRPAESPATVAPQTHVATPAVETPREPPIPGAAQGASGTGASMVAQDLPAPAATQDEAGSASSAVAPTQSARTMRHHASGTAKRRARVVSATVATPDASKQAPVSAPRVEVAPSTRSATPVTLPETTHTTDLLAAELAYLERAQRALQRGDAQAAIAAAREHEREFPHGRLREERLGVEALSRCALGHDGQAVVRALERAAPHSPLLARVRSACGVSEP